MRRRQTRKRILYLVWTISCLMPLGLTAQQLPIFTQYREYHSYANPATVNSDYYTYEYNLSFGLSYRKQWTAVENTPTTAFMKGEYIWDDGNAVGLLMGGYLIHDDTDPTSFTGAYGRIGGIITDDPYYGGLCIGITAGIVQYRLDVTSLKRVDQADPVITQGNQSKVFPDFGVGIFYYQRLESGWFDGDNFYAGLSVPQTFGLDLNFKDANGEFNYKRTQHFYALLGYYKFINEDSFLEPSAWIKYVPNVPINVDFNLRFQISHFFWLGAGGSTNGTFHMEGGFLFGNNIGWDSNVKIGYGYDWNFSTFGPRFGPTHEINLSYTMDTKSW